MWPATPEWKTKVLELMEKLDINRAELSRRIKVSDAAISILFREETKTSRLVPLVNAVVGLAPPAMTPALVDEYRSQLDQIWPDLTETDRKLLIEMAEKIAQRKK